MRAQFDNIVLSSYYLFLDNYILTSGAAFTNTATQFYPTPALKQGYLAYSAPFQQFVGDFSITGASIPTGIYLNSSFLRKGQSGFHDIDYENGTVYFSGNSPATGTLTGGYAVKDFNIYLSADAEEEILFETKHSIRPRISQFITGLGDGKSTVPAIYLRTNGSKNEPYAFGGLDLTSIDLRGLILADSLFQLDAVSSLIRDTCKEYVPLVYENEMPYNSFGGYKGANYNYTGLIASKNQDADYVFVDYVSMAKFNQNIKVELKAFPKSIFVAFFDVTLQKARTPH